jgi:hypothetical protein
MKATCPVREDTVCPDRFVCDAARLCRHLLLAPTACLHFVGFRNPRFHKDPRYDAAARAFGPADVVHRVWDERAWADVAEGDVVVFAVLEEVVKFGFDDSHEDHVVAAGGVKDR